MLGIGITWIVCYAIVSILFAVIGMFILGYFFNKWTGVFKVLVGVILAVIACIAAIISIFTTAIVLINFAHVVILFFLGGIDR